MIVSLGEIESAASLAARGAGYSWGLAEEAGKAARWLAARRLPWQQTFLAVLGSGPAEPEFVLDTSGIRAKANNLISPLSLGTYIADTRSPLPLTLRDVRHPLWLLPSLAARARERRAPLEIGWDGAVVTLMDQSVSVSGDKSALWPDTILKARVDWGRKAKPPLFVKQSGGVSVDPIIWSEIETVAARTYVPASEKSRLRGAGAGVSDID